MTYNDDCVQASQNRTSLSRAATSLSSFSAICTSDSQSNPAIGWGSDWDGMHRLRVSATSKMPTIHSWLLPFSFCQGCRTRRLNQWLILIFPSNCGHSKIQECKWLIHKLVFGMQIVSHKKHQKGWI